MNSRLSVLLVLLAAATAVGLLLRNTIAPSEPPSTKPRIAFVTGGSGPYWQTTVNGARAAAKEVGAELEVLMPQGDEDVEEQIKLLLSIDKATTDGVAVSPLNAEQQTRIINRLSTGALIVTFDSDAPLSNRLNFVGASNLSSGKTAAQLLCAEAPSGAKVAVLLANRTKNNLKQRLEGFREAIAGMSGGDDDNAEEDSAEADSAAGPELVAVLVDGGDNARCKQQLLDLLAEHEDLYGLAAMNARHGPIVSEALAEAGRVGDVRVIAFDDLPATLEGVANGVIDAVIAQDPYHYGFEAVRNLAALHSRPDHQLPIYGEFSILPVGTQVVRSDNLEEFRQMKERLAGAGK